MRNPAPLILSLLLAVTALVLIIRQPDAPVETAGSAAPPAPDTSAEAGTPPAVKPWPHDRSDIPADPTITFGSLDNGMRFIIQPNAEPPERVSVRLHIAAGSLMEAEDQRGLAHFLEHMVFNGTRNFTSAELIPRMQRLGIAFGAHANAYTSFDETVYMLDLPNLSDEMLDLGFTVMRDFADGALLEPEEIDKERGVIMAELTSRDSVGYRLMKEQFSTLLPDSLVTKRFPIGEEEVIRNAPRERFTDFYSKYYVPRRMTFVVVGAIDPAAMEERIRAAFGGMTNPDDAGADPDVGTLSTTNGLEPLVFTDKELPGTEVGLLSIKPFDPRPDDRASRAGRLRIGLSHAMLGRRFDRIAKQQDSPIVGGSASRQDLFQLMTLGSVDVSVTDGRWEDAVAVLENEYRRALEFGFTEAELAETRANLINALEQAVANRPTMKSGDIATALVQTLGEGHVLSSAETDLEVAREIVKDLTPADCHAAFTAFWKDSHPRIILTSKDDAGEDTAARLESLYREASEATLEAPVEEEVKTFAHTDFGPPGTIMETETFDDLGITRLTLSNGVTVNFKRTEFDRNRISLSAWVGHGKLLMPADMPGLDNFAEAVVNEGGIGEHSAEELRRILAGRNVGAGFGVEDGHFSITGTTTPDDLELQLQLMTAQLMLPGFRDEAVEQFRKSVPMTFQQLAHTPDGAMQEMWAWLHGNDPRFDFPDSPEPLLAMTPDDIRPWLASDFTGGSVELNVIGDFDPEKLTPLVLSTFGAIPSRPAPTEEAADLRKINFPNAPARKVFDYESKIEQGQGIVVWRVPGPRVDERRFRRINLLSDILADRFREEIREKLGASYSPFAAAGGSRELDDYGFVIALSTCKPDDAARLAEISRNIGAKLASDGASEDELDRALTPVLTDVEKSLRDNSYWLGSVLCGSTADDNKLELARDRVDDIRSITLKEINAIAAEYLTSDRAIEIEIRPRS